MVELGNTSAMFNLSKCHLKGIGTTRNFNLFIHFIEKSAAAHYSFAFFEYGFLLLHEFCGMKKEKEAISYFKKSADNQEKDGMFWYGLCVFEGKGIKKDIYEGFEMMKYSMQQKYFLSELYLSAIKFY
jgi:TPR repeat protein